MKAYHESTTDINDVEPSMPLLDSITISYPNFDISKTLIEGSFIHSKEDHMDNKDEDYEYLILKPKYYKKGMLSNKGKGIL